MSTVVENKTKDSKLKDKDKNLQEATKDNNLDEVLHNVKKIDTTCNYTKCKKKTSDFAIQCQFCGRRFCTTHGLPEIHGCGEAVRREEKRKFLHPPTKLTQVKHTQAADKLSAKLKQMQFERKSKQCSSKK